MLTNNPKKAVVKEYVYPCGCKSGVENSKLAKNARFFDHCGTHKGLPNPVKAVVYYHI